jgi:hypothetical protein
MKRSAPRPPLQFALDFQPTGLSVQATYTALEAEYKFQPVVVPWGAVAAGILIKLAYDEMNPRPRRRALPRASKMQTRRLPRPRYSPR